LKLLIAILLLSTLVSCRGKNSPTRQESISGIDSTDMTPGSTDQTSISTTVPSEASNLHLATTPQKNSESTSKPQNFSYKVIPAPKNTFGYEIYLDGKAIPGMPGLQGFSTKDKAEKTAKFVIRKLQNNIMPPTVSEKELDSLGVLK
jgi:hypothetical protein